MHVIYTKTKRSFVTLNMASRFAFVVTLACLFQAFNCETTHDVIDEYLPKIDELATYVDNVNTEAAKSIGDAYTHIQSQADAVKNEIAKMRLNLSEAIIQARKDAIDTGKYILKCVIRANLVLQKLHSLGALLCTGETDLAILKKDQLLITVIYGKAKLITATCVALNPTDGMTKQLRECYEKNIKRVRIEADDALAGITRGLDKVEKVSAACLEHLQGEKENVLQTAIRELNLCVENSKF